MVMADLCQRVTEAFEQQFPGSAPRLFQAPGRVNLIGEHTDYNDGFVMPVAIDRHVILAARARQDGRVRLWSVDLNQAAEFSLDAILTDADAPWSNYVRGVANVLQLEGFVLQGMDAAIAGNVPIGSGLSSSAAIEMASALAFCALHSLEIPLDQLALLCQRAENDFVGMRCGIMDPFIAALGQPGHALWIDCRSLEYDPVPVPVEVSIVVCDTMKRRGLVDSEYNARRQECQRGVELLQQPFPGIRALRDVSSADLSRFGSLLPPVVRRRCMHVVSENERVTAAVDVLREGSVTQFGRLMDESHASLRRDYEVSCLELDLMVELARQAPGCLGARMTGAGFGGCTVNWVSVGQTERFAGQVSKQYLASTGVVPEVYICQASGGAGEL